MPDISMCLNAACPFRSKCYRHAASGTMPSEWQSYMDFRFVMDLDGELICSDYWPVVSHEAPEPAGDG